MVDERCSIGRYRSDEWTILHSRTSTMCSPSPSPSPRHRPRLFGGRPLLTFHPHLNCNPLLIRTFPEFLVRTFTETLVRAFFKFPSRLSFAPSLSSPFLPPVDSWFGPSCQYVSPQLYPPLPPADSFSYPGLKARGHRFHGSKKAVLPSTKHQPVKKKSNNTGFHDQAPSTGSCQMRISLSSVRHPSLLLRQTNSGLGTRKHSFNSPVTTLCTTPLIAPFRRIRK